MYLLTEMVRKGQIELLGGGFYNPLAPLISTQDMTGQVEALSAFIRKTFGKRPSGAWLYEYAWTPSLPAVLQNSKIQYSFLPAQSYMELYPKDAPSSLFFASEDHRKTICLFPVFEARTEDGIFEPYEKTLLRLQQAYPQFTTYLIMADGYEIASSVGAQRARISRCTLRADICMVSEELFGIRYGHGGPTQQNREIDENVLCLSMLF